MKTVGVFCNINLEKRKSNMHVSPLSTRKQVPVVLDNMKSASDPRFPALLGSVSRKSRSLFGPPKSNIQIELSRIKARVLSSKLLHFVSLTYSFIMLDAKLLKPLSCM